MELQLEHEMDTKGSCIDVNTIWGLEFQMLRWLNCLCLRGRGLSKYGDISSGICGTISG